MLSRATEADKQSMAKRETDDSVDLGDMAEGIVEEDQVHLHVILIVIVLLQQPVKLFLHCLESPTILIELRVEEGLISWVGGKEISKKKRISHYIFIGIIKSSLNYGSH